MYVGLFCHIYRALLTVTRMPQILRLKNYWWLFPTDNMTLLRLKGDAAFAVAAIAREGDLQRGRLQEAGAIQVLEQLWMGMMHNVDGEASAGMREEAQVALRAVRGGGESLGLRTPPISGSSTPFSSSRASSPGSSPRRRRGSCRSRRVSCPSPRGVSCRPHRRR